MSSFAEYTKNRKKKKEEESVVVGTSFGEFTQSRLGIDFLEDDEEDIAPVRSSKEEEKKSNETTKTKERTYFEAGRFRDGYQFGDITKTILGTTADISDNVTAGVLGMGEKVVDAGAYVVGGVGGLFGADKFKGKVQDFIKKDLYDEEKIAQAISPLLTPGGMYGYYLDDDDSVLGEKVDSYAQSGGQLLATYGLQAVGVPWWLTTGTTSFGGEVETAFKEEATYGEAGLSGAITAGADVITELLSGGIKFGGKTLDAGMTKLLADKISNKAVRTATKLGMDVVGEGSEEVLAGMISNLGTSLYKEENIQELLFSEEAIDEYIESFIGGAVLGGGVSGVNAMSSISQGRDYTTGLTENEQKVIDKEVENRIKLEEDAGNKVDKKKKSEIKEQVQQELEKGGISIDTIESALGGETYDSYKSITEQEETLKREIEQLKNDPRPTMQKKVQETEEYLRKLEESGTKTQLKEQLSREVSELAKSDRVVESYNEQARRSQPFEADLSKYDEKQRENVQRAVDSGILNNTRRTHEFVDMVSKLSAEKGVLFDFTNNENLKKSGFAMEGKTVNGLVTSDGNVVLNIDSKKALNTVVGHEITHVLEGTDLYTELQNAVKEYATTKGEYQTRYDAIAELYKDVKGANIDSELTADLVGDYLFTDSDFVNNLSATKPNLFKKIYDEIKYLVKVATAGSKEAKELEKVKRAFEKAYKETGKVDSDAKYSLYEFEDGRRIVEIDQDQAKFDGHDRSEYPRIAKDIINEKFNGKVIGIDNKMFVNGRGRDEFTHPSKPIKEDYVYDAKMKASAELDNLLDAGTNFRNEADGKDGHVHKNVIGGFDYYDTLFKVGDYYFEATVNIENIKNGKLFKDVTKIKDVTEAIMNSYGQNPKFQFLRTSSMDSIPQNQENSTENAKFSLSGTEQDIAPTGNYNVYGKDIALAPVQETVTETPVQETVAETPTQDFADDYAPLTEEQANERDAMQSDRIATLDESYMPDEVEAPIYDDSIQSVEVESPFDEKDIKEVGNRKVKAYMYENPEVKPYFQEEAQIMLGELQNSIKGERIVDANLLYESGGEFGVWGTKRLTSEHIEYLLDNFKYTYADIEKGLKAIIEDHGAENNAISKRIEFLIDERLREGYKYFMSDGDFIPPNEDYINLLRDKQITSYSDEAYQQWLETLAQEYAKQDIAPTDQLGEVAAMVENTAQTEDIAPITDEITTNGTQRVMDFEAGEIVDEAETPARKTHGEIQRAYVESIKKKFSDAGLDFDTVLEKAKDKSTFASVDNTPQRFIEKSLGYKEGQLLSEMTIEQEALNESKGVKWLNSFTSRKDGTLAKLSKKYGIKPNSKEDAAAQMYGEGFYVTEAGEYVKYGDKELALDFPDVEKQRKIKELAKDPLVRKIYDETLTQINESRVRNGYPEIPRRKDYFLHFRAMDDTFSRLGIPFNPNDIKAKDLPTDINGMTADLKPGQPYFASAMQRKGDRTSYSLLGGMERYLTSAKNQIYHIDDIQTLRGLRNYIADMYGQAHGLENLDTLTEEEAEARIKEVYGAHLSNFAKFLNEQANVLAGKTSLIDRGLEGVIGRRGISTLNTINSQVAKNMVGFNVSSSLTNFVGAVQGLAKANKYDAIKALSQVAYNKMTSVFGKTDGFAENDPGIIRRKGADKFYRTPFEKVSDVGYTLMGAVDSLTSEFLIRAKYNELTRKGMDSEKAHIEADKWAMRILGDRSLGQQPQLYNSKMLGLITKFQLEVRNQLDSMFYDTVQEANVSTEEIQNGLERNAKKSAKIASTMVQLAVLQHLFGKGFEAVAGYNPAFDIISVLMTLVGYDDDEESEDTFLDNTEQAFLELLGDLPYTSTLTGGRIPIQSALPITQLIKGEDNYGNEKPRWETLLETLPYYVMPGGYNQIKKTTSGLGMFDDDLPVSGSYTDSGNLRFPIEDTPLNRVQAGIFGQWANEYARDYFDNERKPLKEKQIQEYADLDIPISEYWKYREGLAEQETLEDKFDYIAGLDYPVEKKNIMINNIVDREEAVDLTDYDDFSSLEEFDFATKNPEKYDFFKANNISYQDYSASEESKNAYTWAFNNPEKYEVAKAISDNLVTYRQYVGEMNDIKGDKDSEGKTISGSRKEKVTNYINSLNTDYYKKILLFKSEYPSDDTYNYEIIEYLNGREDISYSQMTTILNELGFTVDADGTVRW